jgi:hypothetical protein
VTLLTDGRRIFLRTAAGEFYDVLRDPLQPLLVVGSDDTLKELSARVRPRRKGAPRGTAARRARDRDSGFGSRDSRPAARK